MHAMNATSRFLAAMLLAVLAVLAVAAAPLHAAGPATPQAGAAPLSLDFGGTRFHHRWSKDNLNEFTPQGQDDLARWTDMLTINVHPAVGEGEALARLANAVLARYQEAGTVLRTHSVPATDRTPAEHLVVAVFVADGMVEVSFARFVLVDGSGYVVIYGHRGYGEDAASQMDAWIRANGEPVEIALMGLRDLPGTAALQALPQSR